MGKCTWLNASLNFSIVTVPSASPTAIRLPASCTLSDRKAQSVIFSKIKINTSYDQTNSPDSVGSACFTIKSQMSSVPFMLVVKKTAGRVGDHAADVK